MNNFRIVESFIEGKSENPSLCEDAIFCSEYFAAVIDGATSKDEQTVSGLTGGKAVAQEIGVALSRLDPEIDGHGAMAEINLQVSRWRVSEGRGFIQLPTASLIVCSIFRQEIWSLGDCACLLDGALYAGAKQVDLIAANFRRAVIRAAILGGDATLSQIQENDVGRAAIIDFLKKQQAFQNNPEAGDLAYGAIDGNPAAVEFLEIFDARSSEEIVLASDGYPKVLPTLAESEEYLRDLLSADPLVIGEFPSTKGVSKGDRSFDDRAYVRLSRA